MNPSPKRVSVLRAAVVLGGLFNVFVLFVLVRFNPIVFTLFMFFGELLFAAALLLLLAAILADLRAKQLMPWGPEESAGGDATHAIQDRQS